MHYKVVYISEWSCPPFTSIIVFKKFKNMHVIHLSYIHYNDVIMSAMASRITTLATVYSTVYSRGRSKKTSKLRVTGLCEGNSPVTGELSAQRASNAENVSIWWRHHVLIPWLLVVYWPSSPRMFTLQQQNHWYAGAHYTLYEIHSIDLT